MFQRIILAGRPHFVWYGWQDALQSQGCQVWLTHDGTECVDLIHEHNPDVVILDVSCPSGGAAEILAALHGEELAGLVKVIVADHCDAATLYRISNYPIDDLIDRPAAGPAIVSHLKRLHRFHCGQLVKASS